ncbi:MAG TPA: long-chain fatty acid--CoA ligase [Polyangiaceae bacterium]|jgi:long-chain acyl-CoA synthetase|nr:long-chain fatty acid--CoA ligase [Polyangiaceae bacterium]
MDTSAHAFNPKFTNLVDLLKAATRDYGPRPLFGTKRGASMEWTTYAEFGKLVDEFRGSLATLGVGRGDRVAVISNNRLEWAVGAHAVYGLAASYVPMYEAQLDKEWQYILGDSDAKVVLVANDAIRQRVEALRGALPNLLHVVDLDGDASDPASYQGLLTIGRSHPVPAIIPQPDELASLIYTSGTTGNPKGVMLTHLNLCSNLSGILEVADVKGEDRGVAFLPWAHVFGGCVELNLGLATGGSTAICGDATKLAEYLALVKPTVLFAVPRVWNKIYAGVQKTMATKPAAIRWAFDTALTAKKKKKKGEPVSLRESIAIGIADKVIIPKVKEGFGGQLRFACSGAAALAREVAEFMECLGIEVYEGYGMTEGSGCTTAQPRGNPRLGSVGKPIPGVRIFIDKDALGAFGDEGEVIMYGPSVMRGYHKLDEVTRQTLTPDGGIRTGDLGKLDSDGYLYITGRVKELYKLENGKYVAPVPLEEKLQLSPYVAQCVVFGSDKQHNVALIIPDLVAVRTWAQQQGMTEDGDALLTNPKVRALLEQEVAKYSAEFKGYERIVDFVVDTEEMTTANGLLTPTLKLKRRQVVAKYQSVFDSLYPAQPSSRPEPRASYIRELMPAVRSA